MLRFDLDYIKERRIKYVRTNNRIRAARIKLVTTGGEVIGEFSLREALDRAKEEQLDLVEVVPNAIPSICKIMDWGKHKYDLSKKTKSQKSQELKAIRLSPKIGEHDLLVKVKRAIKFLEKGDKVKAQLFFKGREITHKEVGMSVLNDFKANLGENAKVEQEAKFVGREVSMIFSPVKKA